MTAAPQASEVPAVHTARVALRHLAIPAEHGAWGFLFEPIALALLVAPSLTGLAIAMATLAAFLARHPLRLAATDWLRRRRYSRTVVCERLAAAYVTVAIVALLIAIRLDGIRFLIPLAVAAPVALWQFIHDARNRGRATLPEMAGAVAMGSVAAAIALAAGRSLLFASALWCVSLLRLIPAIVFVHAVLGRSGRSAASAFLLAAVAASIILWQMHLAPAAVVFATLLLLARAVATSSLKTARQIGMRELAYGATFVLLIGVGYRLM